MITVYDDAWYMKQALQEAEKARLEDEVPIGAVIVSGQQIIARGYNQTERLCDVTAHAEMLCLTAASNFLDSKYLPTCTLYVTCEPCLMCAGALAWAQIGKIVWAAPDDKGGFMRLGRENIIHPKTATAYGIMMDEASEMLKKFFQSKRK